MIQFAIMHKRLEYILKHNVWIQVLFSKAVSSLLRFIGLFIKTQENLVLMNSMGGRTYDDSPKAITEYLKSHKEFAYLDIVWAFDDPDKFEIPCRKLKIDTLSYFVTALKAKYWVSSVNIERGLHFKSKKQIFMHMWHGVPFKLVGNDVKNRKDFDCMTDDFYLYSGDYEYAIYTRAFKVNPKAMVKCGWPRNDELYTVTPERIKSIKKKLDIPLDKKVILYAPTWRDSTDGGSTYIIKPPMNMDKWKEQLSKDYVLLFKAHSFTTQQMGLVYDSFCRDFATYSSINELMMIADVLVSDYSGTIFDYSILEKPIISFAYDIDTYAKVRGLYLDMDAVLPHGICRTEDEVIERILTMDYIDECKRSAKFKHKYMQVGGRATEYAVKLMFGKMTIDEVNKETANIHNGIL